MRPGLVSFALIVLTLQLVELIVPALIILLIGAIKNSLTVDLIPEGFVLTDTPVATYESMQNVATFPNVLCYDNNMFLRYVSYASSGVFWGKRSL